MEPENRIHRIFELRVAVFFLVILLLLFGSYTQKMVDENRSLKASMEVLETFMEQQKQKNQQEYDSLQVLIRGQERLHLRLRDSLILLENQRLHLKKRSHENKAAIHRMRDVDSLHRVVARHYR